MTTPTPALRLYTYAVRYTVGAGGQFGPDVERHITVTGAIDAADAKVLAASLEAEPIRWASARRIGPALEAPAQPASGRDPLEDPLEVWAAQGHAAYAAIACEFCHGTGTYRDAAGIGHQDPNCGGTGRRAK